jgi:hypothetical protein
VQPEQDAAVMIFTVDRIFADVIQRVMHPAHIPLIPKAETAELDRPRYLRPCGGFLRRCGGMRETGEHFGIEAPQEVDRFEVLPSAVNIGDPAASGPAIVEIQH